MAAAVKLAGPLLRATLSWQLGLIMAVVALAALVSDSVGIGLGASAGAGALLTFATALGVNLRRCRNQALAAMLPGFVATGPKAAGIGLVILVLSVSALDGWRPDSLLAICTAAVIGLGAGLSIPLRWLQWLAFAPMLLIAIGNQDLVLIWTGAWSPLLGAVWLLLGLFTYRYGQRRRWIWSPEPPADMPCKHRNGHQPWRPGYLLSPWSALSGVAMGAFLGIVLPIAAIGEPLPRRLDPALQVTMSGYLVLFSGVGIISMLGGLLSAGMRVLRKLVVLPGWGRMQLFAHAEMTAWRITLRVAAALALALLLTGAWSGLLPWHFWLRGFLVFGSLSLLGIYAAMWLACVPGSSSTRIIALILAVVPLQLISVGLLLDWDHPGDGRVGISALPALAAVVALSWWLRNQARRAWASISFSRQD